MWLEQKYISLLSNRLSKFKRKSQHLYNFRCIYCPDSLKSENKARAYLYAESGKFWYHCHNCNVSHNFGRFLKDFDLGLYENYKLDCLKETRYGFVPKEVAKPKELSNHALESLTAYSKLDAAHPMRVYLDKRLLPLERKMELYWCENFKEWTNSQLTDKFPNIIFDETRIVIPFYLADRFMFGYQGRTINPKNDLRYITIILDETRPKIYGLDRVDFNRKYYVVEGPFDSMFLPNSIATAGGKISSELMKLNCNLDNAVIVFDNQPRNKDVCSSIRKSIISGFHVFIWPDDIEQKDINDMILSGFTSNNIQSMIDENTYFDLKAIARFNDWKKI